MNRRNFLRGMMGAAAVTSAAVVLPSEVWPFRKIFAPLIPKWNWIREMGMDWGDPGGQLVYYLHPEQAKAMTTLADIQACELEYFAKSIPDLLYRPDPAVYAYFKSSRTASATVASMTEASMKISSKGFRVPQFSGGALFPDPFVDKHTMYKNMMRSYPVPLEIPKHELRAGIREMAQSFTDTMKKVFPSNPLEAEDRMICETIEELNDAVREISKTTI